MSITNRGVAGERVAVIMSQRATIEDAMNRARPVRGKSVDGHVTTVVGESEWSKRQLQALVYGKDCLKGDAMMLKMDECLDMAAIEKGAFFYMSKKYTEVDNWCELDEGQQTATF
ncbi:hypothetical protein GGS26DRAFT_562346 [Hypomontagnella submonticulosa]|nr:hypothetical protein GGS26DRAFT_562346 [Hypomontagnella submonticulosa]